MNAMRIQAGGRIDQAMDTNDRMLYLTAVISVVLLILMLPFLSWIRLINTEALFDVMKVKASAAKKLGNAYSIGGVKKSYAKRKRGKVAC